MQQGEDHLTSAETSKTISDSTGSKLLRTLSVDNLVLGVNAQQLVCHSAFVSAGGIPTNPLNYHHRRETLSN